MAKTKEEKLYELLNLLEDYRDKIEYEIDYNKFDQIVSSKKQALINYDKEEGQYIKLIRKYIRDILTAGASVIIQVFPKESKKHIQKALDYDVFNEWNRELGERIPQIKRDMQNKLIVPVTASYGKGFERGMKDLDIDPNQTWIYMPGHAIPRLTNLRLLNYLHEGLTDDMKAEIVMGLRAGENGRKIARRLRNLIKEPRRVVVAPKIDPVTGKIVRRGYEYTISNKRYSEIIGRTEVNRATNLGRLDSYKQSGVVKSVVHITAGDRRVCPICEPLEGVVYPIAIADTEIPVHGMCRCTWEANEYGEVNQEVKDRYKVDIDDRIANGAPLAAFGDQTVGEGIERYTRHLFARNYNTPEKLECVYEKLASQLKNLTNVSDIEGFRRTRPSLMLENLYHMHVIKNARLQAKKFLKTELPRTSYQRLKTIRGTQILASTTTDKVKGSYITKISDFAVTDSTPSREFARYVYHEMGHNVRFESVGKRQLQRWIRRHKNKKFGFASPYARINYDEDFAESFAFFFTHTQDLQKASPSKFRFIRKEIMGELI